MQAVRDGKGKDLFRCHARIQHFLHPFKVSPVSLPHLDRGGANFKLHARDFTVLLLRVRPFPHLEYIVTVFLDAPLAFVNVRFRERILDGTEPDGRIEGEEQVDVVYVVFAPDFMRVTGIPERGETLCLAFNQFICVTFFHWVIDCEQPLARLCIIFLCHGENPPFMFFCCLLLQKSCCYRGCVNPHAQRLTVPYHHPILVKFAAFHHPHP